MGRRKLTYEFVKEQFEKEGYTLLSEEYITSAKKLEYICSNNHSYRVSWNKWQGGRRCPYCTENGRVRTVNIEDIKEQLEKEGYVLLSTEYINCDEKLKYICPNGHKYSTSWDAWSSKRNRCAVCNKNAKLTIGYIRKEFEKEHFKLLTTRYKNAKQKLEYICPSGHTGNIMWLNWYHGNRCDKCSNRISKWEKEVKKFIHDLGISFRSNDRNQLINPNTNMPLELDVWIPNLNKAVECNGIYWHEVRRKNKCDLIKKDLCERKGIDLLVLTDLEWNNKKHACKDKIMTFLSNVN